MYRWERAAFAAVMLLRRHSFFDQRWVADAYQDPVYLGAVSGFRGLDYAASRYPRSGTFRSGFKATFADNMVERAIGGSVVFEVARGVRNR